MNPEHLAPAAFGGSTPLPNVLLDTVLPTLSDTQMRVLLVVARSTLGWREGTGRKKRDWLSHSQLQKRTGRSGAPVSRAIDTLVKRGLLVVQDEAGAARATARERRAMRSSLFFRLGDGLLGSTALPGTLPYSSGISTIQPLSTALESKDEEEEQSALAPFSTSPSPGETPGNDTSTLERRLHFLKTTKETETKYKREPLSSLLSALSTSQTKDDAKVQEKRQDDQDWQKDWQKETQRFLALFDSAYRVARPDDVAAPPEEADVALLCNYFERGYGDTLERWLPAFFNCSYGFVRRRHYSLHAYLHCFFILQVHAGAINIKSM